jgi:hypothetical protein
MWTAQTGMVNLQDLLIGAGVTNLEGWRLTEARGISGDGLTIVGTGVRDGITEAWVATIPEPSTICWPPSPRWCSLSYSGVPCRHAVLAAPRHTGDRIRLQFDILRRWVGHSSPYGQPDFCRSGFWLRDYNE